MNRLIVKPIPQANATPRSCNQFMPLGSSTKRSPTTSPTNARTPSGLPITNPEITPNVTGWVTSGDPKQVVTLLKGAFGHNGTAVLDIISPCVTFNNHAGSTKSYTWGKENEELIHEVDFVPFFDDIDVDYEEGEAQEVELHDGSRIVLKKLERDYDPTNRRRALELLLDADDKQQFLTGLIYLDTKKKNLIELLNVVDEPLATLPLDRVRPPKTALDDIMESLK